jgi:hypothetical protein
MFTAILIVLIILIIVIVQLRYNKTNINESYQDWPIQLPRVLTSATKPAIMYPGGRIPDAVIAEDLLQKIIAENVVTQAIVDREGSNQSRNRMDVTSRGLSRSNGGGVGGRGFGGISSRGVQYPQYPVTNVNNALSNLVAQQGTPGMLVSPNIRTQDSLAAVSAGSQSAVIPEGATSEMAQKSVGPRQRSVDVSEGPNIKGFDFRGVAAKSASAFDRVTAPVVQSAVVQSAVVQSAVVQSTGGTDEYNSDFDASIPIQYTESRLPQRGTVTELIASIGGPDISSLSQGLNTPGLLSSPQMLKALSDMNLSSADVVYLMKRDKQERDKQERDKQTRQGIDPSKTPFNLLEHAARMDAAATRALLEQRSGIASTGAPGGSGTRGSTNRAGRSFKDSSSNTIIDLGTQTMSATQPPGQSRMMPTTPLYTAPNTEGVIFGTQRPISSD